ncbi:MAG: c-type cytochrome domain-containing protein, partial [Lacipirellulaceae bacterium]
MRLPILICCIALVAQSCSDAAELTSSPEKEIFFENKIRPLLAEHCWDCHNADLAESRLRLDNLQAILDGGDRGPALIPGDAKNSLLIHAVNHSEAELQMPEGDKLSAREIKDLAKWINEGAIWPGQKAELRGPRKTDGPLFTEAEKNFW